MRAALASAHVDTDTRRVEKPGRVARTVTRTVARTMTRTMTRTVTRTVTRRCRLAANALLGQIIILAYAVPSGLQAGTATVVGNALGARSVRGARMASRVGLALGLVVMGVQAAALVASRRAWAGLFPAEPAVGAEVASLLRWVVVFNVGDGVQMVLSAVITGAGKQQATTPVLFAAYFLLGLPLGGLAAFRSPRNGLLGCAPTRPDPCRVTCPPSSPPRPARSRRSLWWGMTLAVWLHVAAYLLLTFGHPHVPWSIDWAAAAKSAADRLAQPAADAATVAADGGAASTRQGRGEADRAASCEEPGAHEPRAQPCAVRSVGLDAARSEGAPVPLLWPPPRVACGADH